MLVSICVATYKRPKQLKYLLEGLNKLTFDKCKTPEIELIIVDNDSSGSAQVVCKEFKPKFLGKLKYEIEKIKGVTYARNRAIEAVSNHTDFIAIIDDDEVPDSLWLDELLAVQNQYDADIVTGPVIPQFEEKNVPEWIIKGKFFEPPFRVTGSQIHVAHTNNVLVRSQVLKQLDQVFDNRFASQGNEDSNLFMRLHKAGHSIVWANEAIVREWIPASRTNVKWLAERAYWGWSSHSLLERELYPSSWVQTIRFIKGCSLITLGILGVIPAIYQGKHTFVKQILNVYRGLGTLSGLFGIQGKWC